MNSHSMRLVSGVLCIASIVLFPLLVFRVIEFSMVYALPMHVGIIFMGWVLIYKRRIASVEWNGIVPRALRFALPLIALFGIGSIVSGFSGAMADVSQSGEHVHHLNAYFENGSCYAIFNKDSAIQMPPEFCRHFAIHLASVFCGFWLLFSAAINWASWKYQSLRAIEA